METEEKVTEKPNVPILMLGLDDAGKTTILYKLKMGAEADPKVIPTIGFNVETIEFENKNYTFWDIGGHDTVRVLWKYYVEQKAAVVFVVDSSNAARFGEAHDFLHKIMSDEDLKNVVLLVISNKRDKENCVTNDELKIKLDLRRIKQQMHLVNTSAFNHQSLINIFNQLKDVF